MGLKVVPSCSMGGQILFTCSESFAVGCTVYWLATIHFVSDRQTDRQTHDSIMPTADFSAAAVRSAKSSES